jgi:hypothetical protein
MGEMTLEQQKALALARARVNAGIDPVGHPNMHIEQGDWVMNPPEKSPTGSNITDTLGNLWEASKLEGLTPEVNPIGGLTRLPSAEKGKVAIQGLANAAKNSTVAQKLGDLLSSAGNAIGSIPKNLLAFESQRNPEAFNTVYQAYKQNLPEVKQAISEATPLGKELHSDMIYNYARQLGLSHEDAMLAEDYTRNHPEGLGAWDIAMSKYKQFPNMPAALARKELASQVYKPFEELSDAEKLKQATQAGVDTATWSFIPARTGKNDLANVGMTLAKKAIMPSIMHVTAPLSSPRIARMAAILAGKGANVAGKVGDVAGSAVNMLPEASLEDLINAGLLDARTMRANQGEQ